MPRIKQVPDFINDPCPLLPVPAGEITARDIAALGVERGPLFYETSLQFAQCLWRQGLPAQAMLQLTRALACVLSNNEPVLARWPLPYAAMIFFMRERRDGQFIGNPRRHFQHLATRMVEPNKALRTWRAWACWYAAKSLLSEDEFPADAKQIRQDGLFEPTFSTIRDQLLALSPANDVEVWERSLTAAGIALPLPPEVTIKVIDTEQLATVRSLAHAIWPQVYPRIISLEQIRYMLAQRYELPVLQADVQRGVVYALLNDGAGKAVGYVAFEPRPAEQDAFLHKLYLLPEVAGKGIGATALAWVAARARERRLTAVRLCVNKHNHAAVRAYLRAGFQFEQDVITDIGDGFVMDDFVMRMSLA
jgi:GNAT superfamily N-acetyltransferase